MNELLLNCGEIKLDRLSRRLVFGDRAIFLRNKEFCLMVYFLENIGRVLSRTQILEDVWDRNIFCPTNTVDVHVSNLRQKLALFDCQQFIKTVHCIGYIFTSNY